MMIKPKPSGRRPAKVLLLLLFLICSLVLVPPAQALDEVNLHISAGISGNALLYKFALEKGFYREEGLDVRPIQAGMLPGIQGLVGGSFDFSQILGQGAGAILRGVPLKIVMVFDTRPLNWLYARKEIRSLQELKGGKQIAVSSFGAALDQMTQTFSEARYRSPKRCRAARYRADAEPIGGADERCGGRRRGQSDGPHRCEKERLQRVAFLRRRFGIRHRWRGHNRKEPRPAAGARTSLSAGNAKRFLLVEEQREEVVTNDSG